MHRETLGVPRVSRCIGLRRRRLAQGLMVPKLRGREGVWGGGARGAARSRRTLWHLLFQSSLKRIAIRKTIV